SSIGLFPYHEKFKTKIFFTPTWQDIYHEDDQRLQGFDYCIELEKALLKTYDQKGFEIVTIPKDAVSVRTNFIQEILTK
ncbi:MAG: hypothetical protein AAGC88_05775, partial [Bacteroidota bacterium]